MGSNGNGTIQPPEPESGVQLSSADYRLVSREVIRRNLIHAVKMLAMLGIPKTDAIEGALEEVEAFATASVKVLGETEAAPTPEG